MKLHTRSINEGSERRRTFLTRTAAVGGMGMLGAVSRTAHGLSSATLTTSEIGMRPVRLGTATVDDFAAAIGQRFSVRSDAGVAFNATLIEANSVRPGPRFRRDQFSIVFDVSEHARLEQGRYRVSHPTLSSLDLFMVPVDLPTEHTRLEAVFT